MIRTRSLSQQEACVMAVSALDDLVSQLLKTCHFQRPSVFLDWVADEATPLIERQLADCFAHPQFVASLHRGDQRLVLAGWMRQWIRPGLSARFAQSLPHLPPADYRLPVMLPALASQAVPAVPAASTRPLLAGLGVAA